LTGQEDPKPGTVDRMAAQTRTSLLSWTVLIPAVAFVALLASWGRSLPPAAVAVVGLLLAGAVLAAVHHAEVVALRVGEPFGSLVLAVAVTVIEVALIVTLMISGDGAKTESLARDTVFAAVMITCNGILGLCLLVATIRRHVAVFNAEGTGGALATVATLATLSLVLPSFTTSRTGPEFSPGQLTFAALASLAVYAVFVGVQTGRHRDYFLPVTRSGKVVEEEHADPPTNRAALMSLGLLVVALVAVVGDAKAVSPTIESGVEKAGFPPSFVGVVIALLVLLPETLAAVRAARRDRVQTSLNLALGSAIASIGLTIPAIAIATIWLDGPLVLGLGPTQIVLLVLTAVVGVLTVVPGRATLLQAGVHLALFGAFLFLAISP
jgi:Ca2+:H+ antiporter